ncbi:MAG: fasciclin domain-containing protein [Burkholderiaceae bacterium]
MNNKKLAWIAIAIIMIFTSAPETFAADIMDTAVTSGSFKTFVAAAKAAGLTDTLKSPGPYTVFAPTDEAFAKLPPETWSALMKDKAKLAQVLSHHIVPGRIMVAEVKPGPTKTVEGSMITLKSDNGKITVDSANVIQSDVVADNGVIQAIDAVVLPK